VFAGMVAHTSYRTDVFGKYSRPYACALAAALLTCVFWKAIFRFLTRVTPVRVAGRTFMWGPRGKGPALALAAAGVLVAGELHSRRAAPLGGRPRLREEAFHPFLQNRLVPGDVSLHINAAGFRGDEVLVGEPHRLVFVLGGSTVLGSRVPYHACHSFLLQEKLRARYPAANVYVMNAGNHWHTSQHSLIKFLFRIRDHRPDVVIVWHGINDLSRSFAPPHLARPGAGYATDYNHFYGPVAPILRQYFAPEAHPRLVNSLFAAKLGACLYSDFRRGGGAREPAGPTPEGEPSVVADFPSLAAFERNLSMLADAVKATGAALGFATQPYLYRDDLSAAERDVLWMHRRHCLHGGRYPDAGSMARGMERFSAATRRVAGSHGVPLLDLEAALPKTLVWFVDDCHLTPAGHARVAEALFSFLVEEGIADEALGTAAPAAVGNEAQEEPDRGIGAAPASGTDPGE
jgi:lysophospholipase L1-like esterase